MREFTPKRNRINVIIAPNVFQTDPARTDTRERHARKVSTKRNFINAIIVPSAFRPHPTGNDTQWHVMRCCTPKRSRINVIIVTSVFCINAIKTFMKESILKRNRINVIIATNVFHSQVQGSLSKAHRYRNNQVCKRRLIMFDLLCKIHICVTLRGTTRYFLAILFCTITFKQII